MNISEIFIRRPIATTLLMVAILFFGISSYFRLPVSDLPNIDLPAITVSVSYPGADPETMANNVASPLEKQFLTIQGLDNMASTSATGDTTIVLQFALDKSLDQAATDVQAAINVATPLLPKNLPYGPTYSKVNPSASPVMYFAVTSPTMPMYKLYDYAYTFIAERLNTVPGVAQVVVYGNPFAVRVQVNPQKLAAKKIGINEVATVIQNQNVYLPTGNLYGDFREYFINVDGQLTYAEAYNQMIIRNDNGAIVRIRDVGNAIDSLQYDKNYDHYLTNKTDSIAVVFGVQTQPGTNALSVINGIKEMLPQVKETLPGSVDLQCIFDKSDFIKESVDDVQMTLLIALSLVVLIIFLYLGKIIDTLIPSLALPMAIVGTFSIMSVLGYSIDILSLLAVTLCIGFLVDDAIVVLENIFRHTEMGKSPLVAALEGSKQIGFTIVSMTLSLSAIFIPLLFMTGVVGRLFHEFAVVIVCAMLLSGFVSLSLTPMLCSRFLRPTKPGEHSRIERISKTLNTTLVQWYDRSLQFVLRHKKITAFCGLGCMIASAALFKFLPTDFLPPDDIGFVVIHAQAPEGTSPFLMNKYQERLSKIAQNNPHMESMVSFGATPDSNKGIIYMRLKPFRERPPIDKVMQELTQDLESTPGVQVFLKTLPLIDLQVSTADIYTPYQYTLRGLNTEDLYRSAHALETKLKTTPGLKQIGSDLEVDQPHVYLKIDRDRASVLNLTAEDIENALSLAYGGIYLSSINAPANQYYAILEVEPKYYNNPTWLSQLYLRSTTDGLIPLNSITQIDQAVGPFKINRINGLPAVNIYFDLDNVPLGTAIKNIEAASKQTLPSNVMGQVQGTASVFKESFANLNFLLLITFFLIYIILGMLYENFFHPLTVMSTLPPAALGGLTILLLFGQAFSLYAFVGFILLLGIVLKNGIILIDFAIEGMQSGKTPLEAINDACKTRFRPILMTTLSALMGAIPIALGLGGMTAQTRRSLGLVIIGGLFVSQILTLYLTPVTYLYLEQLREWWDAKWYGRKRQ
ncbi:MAG: efflux RND transporter permease subunit [Verrucomicrobia bacterium]|nr:efflux RND transporter permease subunit [Verrucomicrobiota bacterium]